MVKKSFESALNRLEQITAELEAGDLGLEKSLAKFSEGMELARYCDAALTEARGRVELLSGDSGRVVPLPFTLAEAGPEDDTGPDTPDTPKSGGGPAPF